MLARIGDALTYTQIGGCTVYAGAIVEATYAPDQGLLIPGMEPGQRYQGKLLWGNGIVVEGNRLYKVDFRDYVLVKPAK